ncbi:MAG: response regulator transcription factor [Bacteroidales bacterium]
MINNKNKDILAYDKDNLFLLGMGRILSKMPEVNRIVMLSSEVEFLKAIEQKNYDLYIVEVGGSDVSGLALIEKIRLQKSRARILINTMCEEEVMMERVKDLRINGVLCKRAEVKEVEKAMKCVLRDEIYCSSRYDRIKTVIPHADSREGCHEDGPTKRELEVLEAIARGDNSAQIARKLGISENTVESFRKKLIQKFDARNAIDLVVKAYKEGWISL